ncbi:DegT/DnrJ/EryC1/StrS family aminotransferase [Candidatus Micrarchaeota archaeon]|nr:DegT/DnrJ/EryC1/StrS family aminotransferase [Candidatus Micrarchaeota archaeon]
MHKLGILARKFYKIPFLHLYWDSQEYSEFFNCFSANQVVDGPLPAKLEKAAIRKLGFEGARALNYARSAIQFALENMPEDGRNEVVVPSFGCTGILQPILQAGLKPVFCDVEKDFNPSEKTIEKALSPRTRAVIVPGLFGKQVEWKPIRSLCKENNLFVVDDASQTLGCNGAGRFGDVAVFSFSLGKMISSTGGGLLCYTRPFPLPPLQPEKYAKVAARAADVILRAGWRKYTLPFLTIDYWLKSKLSPRRFQFQKKRIANLDAAIALKQFAKIEAAVALRKRNARILFDALGGFDRVSLPQSEVFTKFILVFDEGHAAEPKPPLHGKLTTRFVRFMAAKGVECEWSYVPLHYRTPFDACKHSSLSNTRSLWWRCVALPVAPSISEEDMKYVADEARQFLASV